MIETILCIVKARLNRTDDILDDYLTTRISAAISELIESGIRIRDNDRDIVLVADVVCWQYSNRDKNTGKPEWLRIAIRDRFLQEDDLT